MSEKSCFIIMPITTPTQWIETYGGDTDHFKHVLDQMFVPAIKATGLDPITPVAEGADLIHGRIIENLEKADLVFCDMSTLNPNVFFELGIRTALNKPVCLVKDDMTPKPPFDTGIINHHPYESQPIWKKEQEIEKLIEHIKKTTKNGFDSNTMWEKFGLTISAKPTEPKTGVNAELELMRMEIKRLGEELPPKKGRGIYSSESAEDITLRLHREMLKNTLYKIVSEMLMNSNIPFSSPKWETPSKLLVSVDLEQMPNNNVSAYLKTTAKTLGFKVHFTYKPTSNKK